MNFLCKFGIILIVLIDILTIIGIVVSDFPVPVLIVPLAIVIAFCAATFISWELASRKETHSKKDT